MLLSIITCYVCSARHFPFESDWIRIRDRKYLSTNLAFILYVYGTLKGYVIPLTRVWQLYICQYGA